MNGLFIVLEGPDGSGTTLQSKMLAERLITEGHDVLLTAEPTEGGIGKTVRSLLNGEEMPQADAIQLLFCADRAEHVQKEILPALAKGTIVISDRYALSTIIYGEAQGVDKEWLEDINKHFPKPDLTIITLPSFDVCQERIGRRDTTDHFEKREFQQHVYNSYVSADGENTVFVDTDGEKQDSANAVYALIENMLPVAV